MEKSMKMSFHVEHCLKSVKSLNENGDYYEQSTQTCQRDHEMEGYTDHRREILFDENKMEKIMSEWFQQYQENRFVWPNKEATFLVMKK